MLESEVYRAAEGARRSRAGRLRDEDQGRGMTCVVRAVGGGAEFKGIEAEGGCRGAAEADGVGAEGEEDGVETERSNEAE